MGISAHFATQYVHHNRGPGIFLEQHSFAHYFMPLSRGFSPRLAPEAVVTPSTQPSTVPMAKLASMQMSRDVDSEQLSCSGPTGRSQPLAWMRRSRHHRRLMSRSTSCSHKEDTTVSVQ